MSTSRQSTGANGAKSKAARISRAKRYSLSAFPIYSGNGGKHLLKQGFPNTKGAKG